MNICKRVRQTMISVTLSFRFSCCILIIIIYICFCKRHTCSNCWQKHLQHSELWELHLINYNCWYMNCMNRLNTKKQAHNLILEQSQYATIWVHGRRCMASCVCVCVCVCVHSYCHMHYFTTINNLIYWSMMAAWCISASYIITNLVPFLLQSQTTFHQLCIQQASISCWDSLFL